MNNVKAIKEIFTEGAFFHHCLQVAVGGSNDADIAFCSLMAANRSNSRSCRMRSNLAAVRAAFANFVEANSFVGSFK